MLRLGKPSDFQSFVFALLLAVILHPVATFPPHLVTPPSSILRRNLRAPSLGHMPIPNAITFRKPSPIALQRSPIELTIDSTFGFVASEEASEAACQQIPGISNQQRNLCRSNPGLIWALIDGTQLGLYECVHQFKNERWNCSVATMLLDKLLGGSSKFSGNHSLIANPISGLQNMLRKGTSETAFVTAAWAASAVQAVARACSRGRISTCDCDGTRRGGSKAVDSEGSFTWGGCSDPIRFGMRLARLFQEPRVPSSAKNEFRFRLQSKKNAGSNKGEERNEAIARILMDIHNQKVGRRFIWQTREKKCKCHGVSGACSMRTCWQRVGAFRGVGNLLKKSYFNALQVSFDETARQLRRQADPLYFGGMPLPGEHLKKRSVNWFIGGGGSHNNGDSVDDYDSSAVWQRKRRGTQLSEKWIKRQKDKLVYLDHSQDYCKADRLIGHLGVMGRQCDVNVLNSKNSCSNLCCGRGYDTFEVDIKEKCDCKFVWCCEVKCNICSRKDRIYRCKPETTALSRRIDELLNASLISVWMGQRRGSTLRFR